MEVLHPSYKDQYFVEQGWEADWVETARKLTRDEFKRAYTDYGVGVVEEGGTLPSGEKSKVRCACFFISSCFYSNLFIQ
jgi:hypothetical protein